MAKNESLSVWFKLIRTFKWIFDGFSWKSLALMKNQWFSWKSIENPFDLKVQISLNQTDEFSFFVMVSPRGNAAGWTEDRRSEKIDSGRGTRCTHPRCTGCIAILPSWHCSHHGAPLECPLLIWLYLDVSRHYLSLRYDIIEHFCLARQCIELSARCFQRRRLLMLV